MAPDRQTAKGRFRGLLMGGSHETRDYKPEGLPLQFLKPVSTRTLRARAGIWKIKRLDYMMQWQADYERLVRTVAHLQPANQTYPANPLGPDVLLPAPGAQDLAASAGRADALCASALWSSAGGEGLILPPPCAAVQIKAE